MDCEPEITSYDIYDVDGVLIASFGDEDGFIQNYYHCVWGWGGKNNGSFIFSSGISVNSYIFGDMGYVANLNKNM